MARNAPELENEILALIAETEKNNGFKIIEGRIEFGLDGTLKCYLNSTDEKAWLPCDGSFITGAH